MSRPEQLRVGVVGGTQLPGNVRTLLTNVGQLLSDHPVTFNLELVLRDGIEPPPGFATVDPGLANPNRALGVLRTLTTGLISYAKRTTVDVLFQVTKFPLHGCAATIAGRRTGTPVVTRLAGDNFREFRYSAGLKKARTFGLNNGLGRVPVHWSDRVIVLGPHGRSEITKRNSDIPVSEVPQPVARDRFYPVSPAKERELATAVGFPTDKRVFLTVGRLTRRKGMKTVIEAAEQLSTNGVSFRWYIIGEGPMRNQLATTSGVKPLGRVEFDVMADHYRAADLVVHPSLIEGLPNVLLEAAACGTPTVARAVGDSRLVAATTFDADAELPALLTTNHDPVHLGERFDPANLQQQYADVLVKTAERH